LFKPQLAPPPVSGASAIVVTSATGLSATMKIGIQYSSTQVHWDVISSVVGTTVNLTERFLAMLVVGQVVYAYATKANRPMRLLEAYVRRNPNTSSPIDIPVGIMSRVDYWQLATKNTSAQTVQMYFDPQRVTSTLSVCQCLVQK